MKKLIPLLISGAFFTGGVCYVNIAMAEDAVTADPAHYKIEFENNKVRVVRIAYKPGEKSVMHEHPQGVLVYLTDVKGKSTLPDGTTRDESGAAGTVQWSDKTTHLPESTGDQPFELIYVEIKD